MVEMVLPTLATIVITGAIDSINPCAIGVLILLISTMINAKKQGRMMKTGLTYVAAVFLTYLAYGLGLTTFVAGIPLATAEYISIVVGLLVIVGGIIEVKDYFWYGKGFSLMIPAKHAKRIKEKMNNLSLWGVVFLGMFVSTVELPCTGGPYLAITLILAQNFNFAALLMLILYNIIFVMPLIIILIMVAAGMEIQKIQAWKQANKAYMRLLIGIVLIALGWLLMLIANGTINLN